MSISTSNRHCVSSRRTVRTRTMSEGATTIVNSPSVMVRCRTPPGSLASIWLDSSSSVISGSHRFQRHLVVGDEIVVLGQHRLGSGLDHRAVGIGACEGAHGVHGLPAADDENLDLIATRD